MKDTAQSERWDDENTRVLIQALRSLKGEQEMKMFLRDLLTEQELIEMGKRFKAAMMLEEHIPYGKIVESTGLSSATVARISSWLQGGMGGYRLAISRLGKRRGTS